MADGGANPLVASRVDTTEWFTGIGIAESVDDLRSGFESGSWVDATIGGVGTSLEALGLVVDPLGTLVAYGVSWLIEHCKPLSDALDWLAGDPDQISAFARTWHNVAGHTMKQAQALSDAVRVDLATWAGQAAQAYRGHAGAQAQGLGTIAAAAELIGKIVEGAGLLVSVVRGLVRDLIAEFVAILVARLPQWLAMEGATLGLATPVVVTQVGALVAKWAAKISRVVKGLIRSVQKLLPLLRRLGDLIASLKAALRGLRRTPGGSPAPPARTPLKGPATRAPDSPGGPEGPELAGGVDSAPTTPVTHTGGTGGPGKLDSLAPDGTGGPALAGGPPKPGGRSPDGTGGPGGPAGGDPLRSQPGPPRDNAVPREQRTCARDPVDVVSGAVVLTQTDIRLPGLLPLVLTRTHVSSYRVGRLFGDSWASTLDQRVEVDDKGVCFAGEDGIVLVYPAPSATGSVLPVEGPRWPLSRHGAGYAITDPRQGLTWRFSPQPGVPAGYPLAAVVHRGGDRIDLSYSPDGTLDELRHSGGYRIGVDTARRRVVGLRLHDPATGTAEPLLRFGYDEAGRLAEVVNSSGLPQRFEYDEAGRMTSWTDRNGTAYRYAYDGAGRCVGTTGADRFLDGRVEYAPGVTTVTDSLGHRTVYHHNEHGQVVREVDALGNATARQWDRYDRLLSETDPLGRSTRQAYDAAGNLVEVTRPDGTRATVSYNALHHPVEMVRFDGAVWRHAYDDRGNLTAVTDPAGATTSYRYDAHGHLVAVVDPLGSQTTVTSNPAGLPIAVTDPAGATTSYQRDHAGRIVAVADPLGNTTHFGYLPEGKPTWRQLPGGARESWSYDGEGNLVEHVDPVGAVTRFEYTHFDLPAARVEPDGARLAFGYDTELRLVSVTNPQGLIWSYSYDPAGRLVAETDFNQRTLGYTHDAAGQLVERRNGLGQTTTYTHDALGNVVARHTPDGETRYRYDAAGLLLRATSPDADLVVERDPVGRVVSEAVNGATTSYAYDGAGRRVRRRTPSGAKSAWTYDARGLPLTLDTGGHTLRFAHDTAGRQVERALHAGPRLTYEWDPNHRLLAQTLVARPDDPAQPVTRRAYRYRADGLLTGVDDALTGRRTFALDPAGRVTAVTAAGWTERYAYDAAGNLTSAAWTGSAAGEGDREYAGTLIRRAGRVRYEHDAQGRVVLRQEKRLSARPSTWRYTWNSDDRLVAVTTPDGTRWRYTYDPLGRRIAKCRLDAAGQVAERIEFTWDGAVLAEQRRDAAGSTAWEYQPGTFTAIAQADTPAPDQAEVDRRCYAIVADLTGTPTELVASDGQVAWQIQTTIWGAATAVSATGADCPLRFPGQYHDPETGDHYNNQRYYDPAAARYHSPDPLGLAPGPNPHAYVPNPTVWTDPLGLAPDDTCGPRRVRAGQQAPGNLHMSPAERRFVDELLRRRPNLQVYRTAPGAGQGDFVIVDRSNPEAPVGWIVELKTSSGGFAGHQLANAAEAAEALRLRRFEAVSGTAEEVLGILGRGRGGWPRP